MHVERRALLLLLSNSANVASNVCAAQPMHDMEYIFVLVTNGTNGTTKLGSHYFSCAMPDRISTLNPPSNVSELG
jgi:hypothetical protein